MRILPVVTFAFVSLLVYLPGAHADDVSEGRDIFIRRCLGCHAFACNKQGPRLGGLFGRNAGSVEDYGYYSEALKNNEIVWSEKTLNEWFKDPGKIAPQSVMATNGKVEDPAQRRKLISFLKTEDPTINICPQ
ncbi:MAG: c-type cytochrome [Gammaproteobacteria bacterium]